VVDANALPALAELVRHSNRLQNRADLPKLLETVSRDNDPAAPGNAPQHIGDRRVLEEVAQVLRDDPRSRIAWDSYVNIVHNGQPGRFKADYLRLDIREAYQIKTITATSPKRQHEAIQKRLVEATDQLNGDGGSSTDGPAEQAPPGFAKVAKLRLEHQTGAYFLMSREELVQVLRRIRVYPKVRDRLDRLEIVNGFDGGTTHVWTAEQLRRDLG
jgi:hypothetical protein